MLVRCFFNHSSIAHFTAETGKSDDERIKAVIERVFLFTRSKKIKTRRKKKVIRCIHRVTPAIVDRSLMERGKKGEREIETKRKKRFVSRQRKFCVAQCIHTHIYIFQGCSSVVVLRCSSAERNNVSSSSIFEPGIIVCAREIFGSTAPFLISCSSTFH